MIGTLRQSKSYLAAFHTLKTKVRRKYNPTAIPPCQLVTFICSCALRRLGVEIKNICIAIDTFKTVMLTCTTNAIAAAAQDASFTM